MVTNAIIKNQSKNKLVLLQDKKKHLAKIISPANVTWEIVNTEKPRKEYDAPSKNTRMIAFFVKLKPSESKTITVQLQAKNKIQEEIKIKAFNKW